MRRGERPRAIVAKFLKFGDRDLVLRSAPKLKGSNIFVNEDLCEASLEKRKIQLPALQEARRNGKIAYFRHTKLIVKDRPNHGTPQEVTHGNGENSLQNRLGSAPTAATSGTSSQNPTSDYPYLRSTKISANTNQKGPKNRN